MQRPRPYIPWLVRESVIDRQMATASFHPTLAARYTGSVQRRVRWKLEEFFAGLQYHLDHDPPLAAREFNQRTGIYNPDANHPESLIYRKAEDHRIKTLIRGEHGQYSDIALIKRERRRAKPKRQRLKNMKQRRHRRYLAQKRRYALMRRLKEEK